MNDNSDDDEDDGDDVSLERLKAVLAGVKPKHLLSMQQEMIEGRNRAIKSKTGRGKADSKNLKQYSAVKTLLEMVEDFIADRRALGEESDSEEEEDQAPATLSKSQSGDSEGVCCCAVAFAVTFHGHCRIRYKSGEQKIEKKLSFRWVDRTRKNRCGQ